MIREQPLKQILIDTRALWDRSSTPSHVRENFLKIIKCGTIALGAEVYSSDNETKLVYHTCKSRFCTSCGQRATEVWQQEMIAILPDVPYIGITLTIPQELRTFLQANPEVLHSMPAMGAAAISLWAKARNGVRVILVVVQQTFGGFLNFVPHLHVLVSLGGFNESKNRWIRNLYYSREEIMRAWRFAMLALLSAARKTGRLKTTLSADEFSSMLSAQWKRKWNIFISGARFKTHFVKHDGRYIRRPPLAQHRLTRTGTDEVEYRAKDTRSNTFVSETYNINKFVRILMQHVPHRGRHAMRYFGLLAPRCKGQVWAGMFLLLSQKQKPRPRPLSWRYLLLKTFGIDPLLDSKGQFLRWTGRRDPVAA